ncbi:endo-1,4-beta-xylanase 5-like [Prosopis cineraria]|uniref:endo-1,4-beta-xylanase 5-like n=1 Tax=Prosopis cineraria TaxID=364024 RepID=UPI00240FFB30|nr:endo-1,4-beta-xylanase 5-like [Prosopis cineraria]
MKILLLLVFILLAGFEAKVLTYDYTSSIECLEHPQKPQYGGGIIQNPELNNGLEGWSAFGSARIEHRESRGNHYIVSHSRNNPYDSASRKIFLLKNRLYTLSAWIQVNEGNVTVKAVVKTVNGFKHAGATVAKSNCWSMLKGGLTADSSGPAELYFESHNISVEIWVDSISLQPFTRKQWRSHQYQSIEKIRKKRVLLQAVDEQGNSLPNATISIEQKNPSFPFGSAINKYILNNEAYQSWFTSRFKVATFENEMKWYSTERNQGQEDYSIADAMLEFAKQHNIAVRGHNVFWDDAHYQPGWVPSLSPDQLNSAVEKRLSSVVSRFKNQLIAWDVVNENMHFRFLESKLGQNASARIYNEVHKIDGETTLFLNEFNTIEDCRDGSSTPANYIKKIREIQSYCDYSGFNIGIGLESHFSTLNLPYMRAAMDTLAATGLPIWLTELDVTSQPNQAEYLEEILREAYSHPSVEGIVLWTAWRPEGCYRMCLTDNNFKNLPTGDVVDKLLQEWRDSELIAGNTDTKGFFEASLSHGHYHVKVTHPVMNNNFASFQYLKVMPAAESLQTAMFKLAA